MIAECPELGELIIDVSYGGNFYAIVDVQENFKGLEYYPADKLIAWARAVRKDINNRYEFVHPDDPTINGCSHILWTGSVLDPRSTARNGVFYGDKAIDRSPVIIPFGLIRKMILMPMGFRFYSNKDPYFG